MNLHQRAITERLIELRRARKHRAAAARHQRSQFEQDNSDAQVAYQLRLRGLAAFSRLGVHAATSAGGETIPKPSDADPALEESGIQYTRRMIREQFENEKW